MGVRCVCALCVLYVICALCVLCVLWCLGCALADSPWTIELCFCRFLTNLCGLWQVHYQLRGTPSDKPLVLCIHGISADGGQFASLAQELVDLGYQVLMPDLYGRGWSDAVLDGKAKNDEKLYTAQLSELLLQLGPDTNYMSGKALRVIGTSMGGALAVNFTAQYPRLVRTVTLGCPAGLPTPLPALAGLVKVPGVGELLMSMVGKGATEKNTAKAYADHLRPGAKEHWEATVQRNYDLGKYHPGFGPALLDTVRNFPLTGLQSRYDIVGTLDIPKLLVWGRADVVVPFHLSEQAVKRLKPTSTLFLDECGHVDFFCVEELASQMKAAVIAQLQEADQSSADVSASAPTADAN